MLYYNNIMGGGLMQLVAYGAQDIYLTGNPQITFFKVVYRKHTNFSMECIKQSFKGTVGAGARVVATLARNGDLVHDCFLRVPSFTATTYNAGHNIIDNIEVEIGGQLIDKHHGHWMEIHAQLTEGIIAPVGYADIACGFSDSNSDIPVNPFQKTAGAGGVGLAGVIPAISVPLRFWFCRHVGLALPLIALQYHEVNINIKFSSPATADINGLVNSSLWCNYIYLDTDERRRFAQVSHEYLIEQVQVQSFTGKTGGDTLKLNFNHPVKELVWAQTGPGTSDWGGETASATGGGVFRRLGTEDTAANTWQLKLNGHDRFEKQPTTYFTRYQPMKYHSSCAHNGPGAPSDTVAVYSFALKPEEHQPSGTCNFSRIDNAQLIYTYLPIDVLNLRVYAVNYNVLRIMSGMGGLAYSN
jgi:hypothetical protein